MAHHSKDPLGKLRYAPLAGMPLGVVGALIFGVHHRDHGLVWLGLVVVLVWAAFEMTLAVKLLQRLRAATVPRGST
jgi:hypothetical protein